MAYVDLSKWERSVKPPGKLKILKLPLSPPPANTIDIN